MTNPITWFEILGNDAAKLRRFYGDMFGWKFETHPGDPLEYATIAAADGGIGGGVGKAKDGKGWVTVYAEVTDLPAAITKAELSGGKVITPITELPQLSFAIVADPEGHPLGLLKPKR